MVREKNVRHGTDNGCPLLDPGAYTPDTPWQLQHHNRMWRGIVRRWPRAGRVAGTVVLGLLVLTVVIVPLVNIVRSALR